MHLGTERDLRRNLRQLADCAMRRQLLSVSKGEGKRKRQSSKRIRPASQGYCAGTDSTEARRFQGGKTRSGPASQGIALARIRRRRNASRIKPAPINRFGAWIAKGRLPYRKKTFSIKKQNFHQYSCLIRSITAHSCEASKVVFRRAEPLHLRQNLLHGASYALRDLFLPLFPGTSSRGRRNTGLQSIRRSLKSQRFSWPLIQTQSDRVEVRLRVAAQIRHLR